MIYGYTQACQLCRLSNDREIITLLHYEDDMLIIVDCLICKVPMAVLKAHRSGFTSAEKDHVRKTLTRWATSGCVIDWEQRNIPDHAHCHLRPYPFPGTNLWEVLGK